MKDKDKKIVSSAELQKELNEERKAKGLKEMPAVNPTKGGSTNTYCRRSVTPLNSNEYAN